MKRKIRLRTNYVAKNFAGGRTSPEKSQSQKFDSEKLWIKIWIYERVVSRNSKEKVDNRKTQF